MSFFQLIIHTNSTYSVCTQAKKKRERRFTSAKESIPRNQLQNKNRTYFSDLFGGWDFWLDIGFEWFCNVSGG